MNRIDRLVAMVLFLQGRRLTRAEDLASHFEISPRTVYRDISALGEAGVPIVGEAGIGYSLMKGYHLPPVTFTSEEASALATASVLVGQLTDPSLAGPMRSAVLKIRAVLPREEQERLDRIERGVHVRERGAAVPGETAATLLRVQDALARRRVIQLRYRSGSAGVVTEREVEPLGLLRYFERWHLIAWCRLRQDIRDFRLDRVESMQVLAQHTEPREGFELQAYLDSQCIHPAPVHVRVRFEARHLDRARRDWSMGIVEEQPVPGGMIFTLAGGALEWFTGWLLSFGTGVTVLEPDELRARLAEEGRSLALHHGNTVMEPS